MSTKMINRLIYGLAGFVFVVGLAASFGLTVDDGHLAQRVPVNLKVKSDALVEPVISLPNTETKTTVKVRAILEDLSATQNAWLLLARLPGLIIVSALVVVTLRFGVNAARRQVFTNSNVWALRTAAALLIAAPFVKYATAPALDNVIDGAPALAALPAYTTFSTGFLLIGLAFLLVAEAFATGRRAEKDTEGLV